MFNKHAFKIQLQTKLKQFTALALSAALVLTSLSITSPLTVHAIDGDNGNLTTIHGTVKSFPLGFNDKHQFYRVYVIDNQRNLVSKVVDFSYSVPSQVNPNNYYTNPRWMPLSTDRSNYEWHMISDLRDTYCTGADHSGYDITSLDMVPVQICSQKLVGADFQKWFLGKDGFGGGTFGDGGTFGGSGSSSGKGNTGGTTIPPINSNNNEEVPLTEEAGFTQAQITKIGENIHNGEMIIQKDHNWAITIIKEFNDKCNCSIITEYSGQINREYNAVYVASSNDLHWSDSKSKANATGSAYRTALGFTGNHDVSMALAYLASESKLKTASLPLTSAEDLLNTNIPLSSSDSADSTSLTLESTYSGTNGLAELEAAGIDIEKLSSILDIKIPLADEEIISSKYAPAAKFVSWEQSPFNVKGFNQDLSGNHSVTLYDALKYKENGKYKFGLVIEAGMWAGLYKDSTHYQNFYTYGSFYNLTQYYVSQNWTGAGCHYSYMTVLGKNCLVTKTVEDFGLVEAKDGSRMTPSEILTAIDRDKIGYGMHFYYGGEMFDDTSSSETSTYDEPLGSTIGQAPDPSNLDAETDLGNLSKSVTIIKNYVTLDTSTNTETVDGNYTRIQNPHTIEIEDEPNYKVSLWQSSREQTAPLTEADNGNTTLTYQQLTQNSTNDQNESLNGFTTGTVTLDKTEYILYVKLVRTTNPPPPNVTGEFILRQSEITRAVSTAGGTDSKSIPITITYDFPDLTFTCSGISHTYQDTETETVNGKTTTKTVDKTCTVSHTDSPSVTDSEVKVAVKNENEGSYTDVIAQTSHNSFKSVNPLLTLNRKTSELTADSKNGSHTYYFTIFRFRNGEENLNLAEYNQKQSSSEDIKKGTTEKIASGNAAIVDDLGYTLASSKATKNRADAGYVVDAVSFKFKYNSSASGTDARTEAKYSSSLSCSHGNSCSDHSKTGDVTSTSTVEETADIAVQVYSGSANKPLHTTVTTPETGTHNEKYITRRKVGLTSKPALSNSTNPTGNNNTGLMVTTGVVLKFNPFIKMTFSKPSDLKNGNIIKYPVNVLSEYQRELQPNDFAEVDWDYAGDNIHLIDLKSQMWATDERLTNNSASWKQPNSILKGGSSYQLSIADSNMREVTLRTYQAVVPSTDTFVTNRDNLTTDKATTAHTDYVTSAVDSLEQLHIVQRVTTEIKTSGILSEQSINCDKVERGGDISFLHNGSNGIASSDSKYYLSKDISGLNSGANEGDLDVKQLPTTTLYYKVWSDTLGNILIASDSNLDILANKLDGTVVLTKSQGVADLTNQTAIALNDRTLVIEKLLNAVERNTGNDTSCDWASSDGKWYNESFATYIMINETPLKLAFKSPSSRGGVIDPKLCPYIKDKNSQGTVAFTSQFTTDNYSERWGSNNQGKIAEFKGKSVYMKDMNKLLTSKLFYITNMTVQNSR